MYIAIYVLLLIATIISRDRKFNEKNIYRVSLITLWLILGFRYGQGTDFFGYQNLWKAASSNYDYYVTFTANNEFGFYMLCHVFNENYSLFIFLIASFEMLMLNRFIQRYSEDWMFSLLLFFPTFYLTYYFSAIRQGITLALFLGLMVEMLEKKEWKKYIIFCVIAASIHIVALVLFIMPIILKLSEKKIMIMIVICIVVGIVFCTSFGRRLLISIPYLGMRLSSYIHTYSFSIVGLIERVTVYICILLIFYNVKNKITDTKIVNWIKIYSIGIGMYFLCMPFSTLSSRMIIFFKAFEIVIIPYLLLFKSRYRKLIYTFMIILTTVMTIKNISSYIKQGNYNDRVNVLNYPYISIFDKDELWKYKERASYYMLE